MLIPLLCDVLSILWPLLQEILVVIGAILMLNPLLWEVFSILRPLLEEILVLVGII